jgi:toxin CcdB
LVVPVRPPNDAPVAGLRLNPRVEIESEPFVMVTQFAAAVPLNALGKATHSLASERDRIIAALDMLLTGV